MALAAIQTHYAGCYFRSRLEARWAVFFDALGIQWQYEPEGFVTSQRLTLGGEQVPYLPDFYLPGYGVYAEVKGSLTEDECVRLLDIAASMSSADGGGCHDSGGSDLVVFGNIPAQHSQCVPTRLHMHKGDLVASPFAPPLGTEQIDPCSGITVARDVGGSGDQITAEADTTPESVARVLLHGGVWYQTKWVARSHSGAYVRARMARFEHGESGVPTSSVPPVPSPPVHPDYR